MSGWDFTPVVKPTPATTYSGAPDYVAGSLGDARQAAELGAKVPDTNQFAVQTQRDVQQGIQNPVANPDAMPASDKWDFTPVQKPYSERPLGPVESKVFSGSAASKEVAGTLADLATGANITLADALALPVNSVMNVFQGLTGRDFTDVNQMKATIQDRLASIPGMGAKQEQFFNKWWGDLGEKAGKQALLSMALIAGGPALAATGESIGGTAGGIMKGLGETAVTHPGMVAASDAGAVAGGAALPLAEPYLKKLGIDNPTLVNPETLGLLGNLLGGPLGASLSTLARIRPTGVTNILGNEKFAGLPRFGGSLVKEAIPGAKPLLDQGFTADDISTAIKGVQQEVMDTMQKRVEHIVNGKFSPAAEAQKLREANNQAYKASDVIEGQMWSKVDQSRPVPTKTPQQTVKEVKASASDPSVRAADLPSNIINDISKWKPNISMARMRAMSRLARSEAAAIGEGTDRSLDTRARNLTKIANSIDESITAAYPNDINLAKAKAFTQWQHDQFSGASPMAQLSAVRANQARMATDAPSAVKNAMGDSRFPGQMGDVAASTNMTPELQGRSEDYLRSTVSEAYRTGGQRLGIDPLKEELYKTNAAKEYMQSPDFKNFAKAFPAMDAVFQRQTNQLVNAVGKAAEIAKSRFFNLAADQPENAVDHLFNSGSKVSDSHLIMKNIGHDRKAVDALEYSMIRKLGNSVNWDPENIVARLGSKDLRKAFINVMGEQRFGRMERIFQTGAKLQSGEANGLIGMSPTKTAGRILGSLFTGAAGGKSIQVHSIGTKIGGNIMQRIFHTVPPEYFVQKALTDPNWERFLMSKLPDNMAGFRTTTRLIGLMTGSVEAAHHKLTEQGNEQQ